MKTTCMRWSRLAEGKLIANCEDTYTYCLDPATGRQLWQEKSSGTCTLISYLNGVAYFSGGNTFGRVRAGHRVKLALPDCNVAAFPYLCGLFT